MSDSVISGFLPQFDDSKVISSEQGHDIQSLLTMSAAYSGPGVTPKYDNRPCIFFASGPNGTNKILHNGKAYGIQSVKINLGGGNMSGEYASQSNGGDVVLPEYYPKAEQVKYKFNIYSDAAMQAAQLVHAYDGSATVNIVLGTAAPKNLASGITDSDNGNIPTLAQVKSTVDDRVHAWARDNITVIPSSKLPSYVDDVIDIIGCYEFNHKLYRPLDGGKLKLNPTIEDFIPANKISPTGSPGTYYMAIDHDVQSNDPGIYHYVEGSQYDWVREYGETGKIYIEESTSKQYRFAANSYIPIPVIASPGTLDDIVEGALYKHVTQSEKDAWGAKQSPATTLAGYGITDAYINNGQITLGSVTYNAKVQEGQIKLGSTSYNAYIAQGSIYLGNDSVSPQAAIGTDSGQSYNPYEYASTKAVKDYVDAAVPGGIGNIIVTTWQQTPDNSHVPAEKLVYDTLMLMAWK